MAKVKSIPAKPIYKVLKTGWGVDKANATIRTPKMESMIAGHILLSGRAAPGQFTKAPVQR